MKGNRQGFLSRFIRAQTNPLHRLCVPLGTKKKKTPMGRLFLFGAGGGTRTHTVSLPTDFESVTSANSIIPAKLQEIVYHNLKRFATIKYSPAL